MTDSLFIIITKLTCRLARGEECAFIRYYITINLVNFSLMIHHDLSKRDKKIFIASQLIPIITTLREMELRVFLHGGFDPVE